ARCRPRALVFERFQYERGSRRAYGLDAFDPFSHQCAELLDSRNADADNIAVLAGYPVNFFHLGNLRQRAGNIALAIFRLQKNERYKFVSHDSPATFE